MVDKQKKNLSSRVISSIIEERAKECCPADDHLERRLFTQLAPAVYSMACQTLRDCQARQIERLYFVARDGIGLRDAFDHLLEAHPDFAGCPMTLSNLDCSRASTICARYKGLDDLATVVTNVREYCGTLTYENLMIAWNIDQGRFAYPVRQERVLNCDGDVEKLFEGDREFASAFDQALETNRQLLTAYLEQEGVLTSNCALVDVGWFGTIQRNILELESANDISGYYVGTMKKYHLRSFHGCIFDPGDFRTKSIVKAAPLLETILTPARSQSTDSYRYEQGVYYPVYKPGPEGNERVHNARKQALERYFETYLALSRDYPGCDEKLASDSADRLFRLMCFPDKAFVKEMENFQFDFGWGQEKKHHLVSPVMRNEFWRPLVLLNRLRHEPWLFGTLKSSHLGMLSWPLVFLLGINQKILILLVNWFDKKTSRVK